MAHAPPSLLAVDGNRSLTPPRPQPGPSTRPEHRTKRAATHHRHTSGKKGQHKAQGLATRGSNRMCLRAPPPLKMSDSNGSAHGDDWLHHCSRSRSRSPVFPALEGKTSAERDERRLAKAAAAVPH